MEKVRELLVKLRSNPCWRNKFRGLLHLLIGRTLTDLNGQVLSQGLTWRQVAQLLQDLRWDKEAVRELGINPADLPPRDRFRYWYLAISQSALDSPEAKTQADEISHALIAFGYTIR